MSAAGKKPAAPSRPAAAPAGRRREAASPRLRSRLAERAPDAAPAARKRRRTRRCRGRRRARLVAHHPHPSARSGTALGVEPAGTSPIAASGGKRCGRRAPCDSRVRITARARRARAVRTSCSEAGAAAPGPAARGDGRERRERCASVGRRSWLLLAACAGDARVPHAIGSRVDTRSRPRTDHPLGPGVRTRNRRSGARSWRAADASSRAARRGGTGARASTAYATGTVRRPSPSAGIARHARVDWLIVLALPGLVIHDGSSAAATRLPSKATCWPTAACRGGGRLSVMATQLSRSPWSGPPARVTRGPLLRQFYLGLPVAMVILSVTAVPYFYAPGCTPPTSTSSGASTPAPGPWPASSSCSRAGCRASDHRRPGGDPVHRPGLEHGPDRAAHRPAGDRLHHPRRGAGVTWADVKQMAVIVAASPPRWRCCSCACPRASASTARCTWPAATGRMQAIDFRFDPAATYTFWSGCSAACS